MPVPSAGARTIRIAMLALSIAGLGASTPTRIDGSQVGIVSFDLNDPAPAKISTLGVGLVRGSCDWATLEPLPNTFDWRCSDNVVTGAERRGLHSYLTVTCAPDWAKSTPGCFAAPRDMVAWYEFVQQYVARYRRFHTVLGVWNEPNLVLRDDADGSSYVLMFVNASNARHAVDPDFVLAGPEVSHHAIASGYYARVMDRLLFWRALDPQDVVSVHWYRDGPPMLDYLDTVHAAADRNQVWLSEIGYATADPAAQAEFYRAALDTFATSGRWWWSHVIFYRLWDGLDCCTEAIVTADFRSKPAFDAIRDWLDSAADRSRDPGPRPTSSVRQR
jgi:hypothetical protein